MSQDLQHKDNENEYQVGRVWTDLFAKLSGLKHNAIQILFSGLVFALLGFGYSFWKKPVYMARVNFVIEENKQNAGGLFSALAGQVGMDLSTLSGMSGILAGDNVLELLKSPTLLKKVLITPYPGDSSHSLAYKYAEAYGKLEEYNRLMGGNFYHPVSKIEGEPVFNSPPNVGVSSREGASPIREGAPNHPDSSIASQSGATPPISSLRSEQEGKGKSRVKDSLLTVIATQIIEKELSVYKPDRKLSVFRLDLTTRDELLSQTIATKLLDQAANLYIQTKTKRLKLNVDRLQKKSDSIGALLNYRTEASANKDIINQNPTYASTEVDIEISNREKGMLSIIYGDVNKSLDITRTALIQETPTIEIIDTPDLPLKKEEVKWYYASTLGLILGLLLSIIAYLWVKPSGK